MTFRFKKFLTKKNNLILKLKNALNGDKYRSVFIVSVFIVNQVNNMLNEKLFYFGVDS